MEKKHAAIVDAARTAFLESSYAETSMDSIAKAAKVGIKTIYRHFEDKDDLFIAVIQAACQPQGKTGTGTGEDETPAWFAHPPSVAIQIAGEAYLRSILDKNQIALFRLMIRDAHKFPELASRYQREVLKSRNMKFVRYLEQWKKRERWRIASPERAANVFGDLLRGELL
jgi:AcrR family transcriptional regulator